MNCPVGQLRRRWHYNTNKGIFCGWFAIKLYMHEEQAYIVLVQKFWFYLLKHTYSKKKLYEEQNYSENNEYTYYLNYWVVQIQYWADAQVLNYCNLKKYQAGWWEYSTCVGRSTAGRKRWASHNAVCGVFISLRRFTRQQTGSWDVALQLTGQWYATQN